MLTCRRSPRLLTSGRRWSGITESWSVRSGRSCPTDEAWARRRKQYCAWLANGSGFILIARAEGSDVPVGYAACQLLPPGPTFDLGDLRGDVDSLVTAEAARGRGVGTALLNACRDELRRRGARYWLIGVVESNAQAVDLYQRLGFRPFVRTMLAAIDGSAEAR